MKIILGIVVFLLLVSWGGAGFFLYTQYEGRNAVGSYMKDTDKFTCTPITQEEVTMLVQKAQEDLALAVSSESDQETAVQSVMDKVLTTTESLCITKSEVTTAVYEAYEPGAAIGENLDREDSIVLEELIEPTTEKPGIFSGESDDDGALSLMKTVNPLVASCVGEKKFVNEPLTGAEVCEGESINLWPDLTPFDGNWGGCDMVIDKEKQVFAYCATVKEQIVQCTQNGCAAL